MAHIKRILIISHEPCYMRSLQCHLKREGYLLATAKDLEEGGDLFQQAQEAGMPFDLNIIDLSGNGKDWPAMRDWLHHTCLGTSTVVLHGLGDGDEVRQRISPEKDECCPKPMTPYALMEILARVEEKLQAAEA